MTVSSNTGLPKSIHKAVTAPVNAGALLPRVKPWQQPESVNGGERRLSDLVALWYGRHGQILTDGDRRRDKLNWLAEALGNPLATEFTAQQFAAYRERRLAGELYVPGQRKQVSPTTINRELLYLQVVFNELGRLAAWVSGLMVIRLRCCASTRCKSPNWLS
jgi:hypothetical protein